MLNVKRNTIVQNYVILGDSKKKVETNKVSIKDHNKLMSEV